MKWMSVLILTFMWLPCRAGTWEHLEFLGFSEKGVYAAFETYGIKDGSGFPFSSIAVVNIDKNVFAPGTPIAVEGKKEGTSTKQAAVLLEKARKAAFTKAKSHFKSFKLNGENKGVLVIYHPVTDLSMDPVRARFVVSEENKIGHDEYVVNLKQTDLVSPACSSTEKKAAIVDVTLENVQKKKTITLQHDSFLPKSRGCASDYRVNSVYVEESGAVAVFLEYQAPGFEGPDRRFLCITGRLPK